MNEGMIEQEREQVKEGGNKQESEIERGGK